MRYAFVAAPGSCPWLNAPLPPSMARKTVAALQGVVLVVAGAGVSARAGHRRCAGPAGAARVVLRPRRLLARRPRT